MQDIFVDGIRSIAIANGVARIELAQLRRKDDSDQKLEPEPVATLLMPVGSLRDFSARLAESMKKVQESLDAQRRGDGTDPEKALERL